VFTKAKDTQFELVDALLLSEHIRSFPELSLSPVFRRQWPSAYAAIEEGEQNQEWLEAYFRRQIPRQGPQVFSLDGTDWPHPAARTLADRQYIHGCTRAVNGSIVVGHPYSVLAWVPECGRSWAPPVSVRRVPSDQTEAEMGVMQVRQLCQQRGTEMAQWLDLVIGDGKYGNHHFLGPLTEESCGVLVCLRCDRVLYGKPGAYSGHGRPRVHGDRFAFKEPETRGQPDAEMRLEDERWGKVRLQLSSRWHSKVLWPEPVNAEVIIGLSH